MADIFKKASDFIDEQKQKAAENRLIGLKKAKEDNLLQIAKHEQKISEIKAENQKIDIDIQELERKLSK